MTALLGQPVADRILSETKARIESSGVAPGLGIVLIGDDPASHIYVEIKERRAREFGLHFVKKELSATAAEGEILEAVGMFNADSAIHGIVVQLPLPEGIDTDRIIRSIDPMKDADGFLGDRPVFPEAIIELAKSSAVSFAGETGIVLANSERFGKVMVGMMQKEGTNASFLLCYSRESGDLLETERKKIEEADIVVTAIGKSEYLPRDIFKKGTVVIDGGIVKKGGKVVGDVSQKGGDEHIFLSPVPGGVGPVTIACLLRRTTELAIKANSEE